MQSIDGIYQCPMKAFEGETLGLMVHNGLNEPRTPRSEFYE